MRAVLAETAGATGGLVFFAAADFFAVPFLVDDVPLRVPDSLLEVTRRDLGDAFAVAETRVDLLFPVAEVVVRDFGSDLDLLFAETFEFRGFVPAADLRLSRRWIFAIASTSSSFRIPCQPSTP